MRKVTPIFTAFLPLGYVCVTAIPFLFQIDSDILALGIPCLYSLIALVICILYGLSGVNKNLAVKLAALPVDIGIAGYFLYYCIETAKASAEGAMGGGLGVFLLILLLLPYLSLRFFQAVSSTVICYRTAKNSRGLHCLLHLLPIADIVSAAIVHKSLPVKN